MLQSQSQQQLAEATVDMMRACALAAARAGSTPLFQGIAFWSWMLRASAARPTPGTRTAQALAETSPDAAFASYRSSSGHAVAQVIVG
jgi:hypothetical protein